MQKVVHWIIFLFENLQSVYPKSPLMKNNLKPSFYYSAYPLKALEQAADSVQGPQATHLKALLSNKTKTKNSIRISGMINPYKSKFAILNRRIRKSKDIEPDGKDWFRNYE